LLLLWTRSTWRCLYYGSFLSNQSMTRRLILQCKTTVFSRNRCWSRNGSFTEVYKRPFLTRKRMTKNLTREQENIWSKTLLESLDDWYTIFICLLLAKKSNFVYKLNLLFTHWVLQNTCIHPNFCLWKPRVA